MRKELETLLDVISTDEEIGTHGAMPLYASLASAIESKIPIPNSAYSDLSLKKERYQKAILETIPFLNAMSTESFRRLILFSEYINYSQREFGLAIKENYKLPVWCPEQREKRAIYLQHFQEEKPVLFNVKELEGETDVRSEYPWQWIDSMEKVSPKKAQKEIISVLSKKRNRNDFRPFHIRLLPMINKRGLEYVNAIVSNIEGKIPEKELVEIKRKIVVFEKK
ncbi:hypothetical protein COU54_04865 [Candidatus Pacearchaeota archaeon CG10_big_fil_rev_8_21_14_0_10_31_24]|nr:MAG: hypothetical protein COU54_04865 [Candidatus Pacearchaeota archaeon CG10_big_fil_rev_8_21_14_0_10_31_24]